MGDKEHESLIRINGGVWRKLSEKYLKNINLERERSINRRKMNIYEGEKNKEQLTLKFW